jgi:hypothetical protein
MARDSDSAGFFVGRGEASAHGVFGDGPGPEELEEVIGTAGFCTDAGEFVSAEGLAFDECAGDFSVDVEVADAEFFSDAGDGGGGAGEEAAGEGVLGVVGDFDGLVEGFGADDG